MGTIGKPSRRGRPVALWAHVLTDNRIVLAIRRLEQVPRQLAAPHASFGTVRSSPPSRYDALCVRRRARTRGSCWTGPTIWRGPSRLTRNSGAWTLRAAAAASAAQALPFSIACAAPMHCPLQRRRVNKHLHDVIHERAHLAGRARA